MSDRQKISLIQQLQNLGVFTNLEDINTFIVLIDILFILI